MSVFAALKSCIIKEVPDRGMPVISVITVFFDKVNQK